MRGRYSEITPEIISLQSKMNELLSNLEHDLGIPPDVTKKSNEYKPVTLLHIEDCKGTSAPVIATSIARPICTSTRTPCIPHSYPTRTSPAPTRTHPHPPAPTRTHPHPPAPTRTHPHPPAPIRTR